ncbi:MAG TPA: BadF/BadG/BcrA/BcrD ATPase family protein [Steroidobacteraceae bacterium]|jgi:N-acetylglucosamine kinase-like BadF-type ATPase|nr:BadF/BadG/BcrA/BcrD ATPase family protein [Steroidobacteraceae bacterium]
MGATRLYLGVDGGGTKTALVLIDSEGSIRATHLAPGSYYLTIGLDALGRLLVDGVNAVAAKAAVRIEELDFAFFGIPAYGEDTVLTGPLSELPRRALPAGQYLCGNDMICGWAGSLLCRDGISIVAGTGSICYGERNGSIARCGGWGELFSDEGSAYWIACRGLNLFSRMSDGREPKGPLYEIVRERLKITADLDLCAHVFSQLEGDRAQIAQLSKWVTQAATAGDPAATAIIREAALELALMVDATRRQLEFGIAEPVPVSYSGGVFDNVGPLLLEHFTVALQAFRPGYRVSEPVLPPGIGAALYAAKRHGNPLSNAAIERLRAQSGAVRKELES